MGAKINKGNRRSSFLSINTRHRSGQSKRVAPGERLIVAPGVNWGRGGLQYQKNFSKEPVDPRSLSQATIIGFLRFLNLGGRKNTSHAKKPQELHAMR